MDKKLKKPHQHFLSLLCRQESRCSKPQCLSSTHLMYGVGLTTVISYPLGHCYWTTTCRQPPPESQKLLGKPRPFNLPLMHIQTWSPFLNLQENLSDPPQISANSPPTQLELPMAAKMVAPLLAPLPTCCLSYSHQPPLSQSQLFGLNSPFVAECYCGSKCWSWAARPRMLTRWQ